MFLLTAGQMTPLVVRAVLFFSGLFNSEVPEAGSSLFCSPDTSFFSTFFPVSVFGAMLQPSQRCLLGKHTHILCAEALADIAVGNKCKIGL